MSHHALLEYIRKAKNYGAHDKEIENRLYSAGWYRVDIQDALELYHKLTDTHGEAKAESAPVVPNPTILERVVPSTYDPHIIAVASLSFAVGFIIYLVATR